MKQRSTLKKNQQTQAGALAFQARAAIMKLRTMARSDLAAANLLCNELVNAVYHFNCDSWNNPDHYRKIARKACKWPGVITLDGDMQNAQESLARILQLSEDALVSYSKGKRQWRRQTPEIQAALLLIGMLRGRDLPAFNKSTALKWWREAKPLFIHYFGKNFEDHPLFNSVAHGQDASLSQRTSARKQILARMLQAFKTLAPK